MKMVLISYAYVLFFILAFMADRLPLVKSVREISALGKLSVKTIGSATVEDAQKQKILLANSGGIFKQSLKITALILLVFAVGYFLVLAGGFFGFINTPVLFGYLETVTGMIISVLSFCSYFLLKKIYARARL